jgi:hypothetical protein
MTMSLILLAMGATLFGIIRRTISSARDTQLDLLDARKRAAQALYDEALSHKRELAREAADKERTLATLRNSGNGIRTISSRDLKIEEEDDSEKVSRYLISQGKISLEQNQKTLDKMNILQMDYLAVCLTLGFIDLETAEEAAKVSKLKQPSTSR